MKRKMVLAVIAGRDARAQQREVSAVVVFVAVLVLTPIPVFTQDRTPEATAWDLSYCVRAHQANLVTRVV